MDNGAQARLECTFPQDGTYRVEMFVSPRRYGEYQGIGELGPGDADLELLERFELCRFEAGHERGQHLLAAFDIERERPAGVEARREWPAPIERHETVRRLVPDDAIEGCRNPA